MDDSRFARLTELEEMLGPEFVDTLVDGFLKEIDKLLPQISASVETSNPADLVKPARQLLFSCRNLGFHSLSKKCEVLERSALDGSIERDVASSLQTEAVVFKEDLVDWRNDGKSPPSPRGPDAR